MSQQLFIGVDGGATKTIVRVEDEHGVLLGQGRGGPANIRISITETWQSIYSTLEKILQSLGIILQSKHYHFHVGMGLAGCEVQEAYHAFLNHAHGFQTLVVSSDSHTACLGAHGGKDGAIIVVGTGMVGFQLQSKQSLKIGGWGFPHDDEGGGAWIGLNAMMRTLKWLDKRMPPSELTKAIFAYFTEDFNQLVTWANQANSTAFAELAPIVIECASNGDASAITILQQAAYVLDEVGRALLSAQSETKPLPCSLVGGIAPFIEPYLGENLRSRLTPCQATPDKGAILLVRDSLSSAPSKQGIL